MCLFICYSLLIVEQEAEKQVNGVIIAIFGHYLVGTYLICGGQILPSVDK